MATRKISVLIADDHAYMRANIRSLLETCPDIHIVGEASNGREAVQLVGELKPDILLMDIEMPVMDGIQALKILHLNQCQTRILLISSYGRDDVFIEEVMARGAWGYYSKAEAPELIIEAICQAAREPGRQS